MVVIAKFAAGRLSATISGQLEATEVLAPKSIG